MALPWLWEWAVRGVPIPLGKRNSCTLFRLIIDVDVSFTVFAKVDPRHPHPSSVSVSQLAGINSLASFINDRVFYVNYNEILHNFANIGYSSIKICKSFKI